MRYSTVISPDVPR